MNATIRSIVYPVVVALSLGAAFTAHAAGEFTGDDLARPVWNATKTRDQVKAGLAAARAQGLLASHHEGEVSVPLGRSRITREEVRAQMAVERAQHKLDRMYGDDSGSAVLVQQWAQRPAKAESVAKTTR